MFSEAKGFLYIGVICVHPPAQPVQLNVYPVKLLLHLFPWGELSGTTRLFNRDEISVALI